ncbi:MAG TPA: type I glyceraldehyde-3-phosphate dehydrogenase [Firmicutes bacterium]|nr:type I glyceraldehyde-3-phosphate dehydrogenase [Candidatus Fermentithermobacillaceae bacterium]
MVKIGINGFGSIGRRFLRASKRAREIDIVAVNDLTDPGTLSHLLKYDTNYGTFEADVKAETDGFVVGGKKIRVFSERDPGNIPWKDMGVDIVLEATGRFREKEKAVAHIKSGGAKKVVISAPAKGEDLTIVMGVNHGAYDASKHHVISNASCTTNGLAPVAKVLDENFGVEKGLMTTIHAYTNDQVTLDFPHKDLRRGRAAALNIIPTTTGAAKAVSLVLPQLNGKFNGMAFRVPTPTVSVVDLTCQVSKECDVDSVNKAFEAAAEDELKGILGISYEPLVSSDYKGMMESSVVDGISTQVIGGNLVKVVAWYDNEWGYCERLVDLISYIISKGI